MHANICGVFRERFQNASERDCFVTPDGQRWTYGDLDRLCGQFAALLQAQGVEPGDRVVAQVDKSVGAVGLYLGVLCVGAVFVPLNTSYTATELAYFLADCEPRVFVSRPQSKDAAITAAGSAQVTRVLELGSSPDDALWREVQGLTPVADVASRSDEDLAAIVYTSGTTGRSKGAMIPHRALLSNARSLHEIWGFEEGDVLLHALPIFHIHGLFVALHTAFLNASKIIFLDRFDVDSVRRLLSEATILMGVPTFYTRLLALEDFGRGDCARVRLFVSGSAPLTEQNSIEWTERTGHRILERYGMSEAGMITSNPLHGERIPGTVGYALPDVEVRVCDADGADVAPGEVGCVEVRGPNLFTGYWRMPDKTAQEVRNNGFFVTGDLGTLGPDGRLSLVGRSKDLIISAGYNIYPKEIESVLDDLDGVSESAVVGVAHKDVGEGVVAVLVAEDQPVDEGVIQRALDEHLARFKHPRRFYWLAQLPRNAMGKVQKNALREQFSDAYSES